MENPPELVSPPQSAFGRAPAALAIRFRRVDPGLILAGLVALFVIQPLLQPGLPATADTPIHFYRALEFARSWGPGVGYPRWAPHLAYGYGYPLWNFAPPLPYLIPLFFNALGFNLETGVKGLIILAVFSYAGGAYLLARQNLGSAAALVAAAIYTLAPFALREALLYGGNYPQYLAIGLYPWVLWALERLQRRPGYVNFLLVALFYGAIMLSHLFHALIITPVAIGYAVLLWLGGERTVKRLAFSGLALGLGLLGTAFFWLPAFVERAYTHSTEDVYLAVSPIFSRFLNWAELLAWPQALDARAANPWAPFSLGVGAVALAILGVAGLVWLAFQSIRRKTVNRLLWPGLFFLGLLAACLFMIFPASGRVWTDVPLLAVAEFPWRLLGLINLSLAFLGGLGVYLLGLRFPKIQTALAIFGVPVILLGSLVYLYPPRPFVHYGDTPAAMTAYELATRTIGTTTLGEYLPRAVTEAPTAAPPARPLPSGEGIEKLDYAALPANASALLLTHTATSDSYQFDSPGPFQARFFTFYFPGWRAELDGQPLEIAVEPETGLITAPVPAGRHTLRLVFNDTPLRSAANGISLITLVGVISAGVWQLARKSPPSRNPQTPVEPGWKRDAALWAGGILIGLLALKGWVIDPHTAWFRQQSPPEQTAVAQHPLKINLDDRFWLLGYDLDNATPHPGDTVRVVLYWQAQRPADTNYRSFVHLDAPTDRRTWSLSDNFHPGDSTAQIDIPTSTWDIDHYIRDEHFLTIPPGAPPVRFDLRAGLYNPQTGQRLPAAGSADGATTLASLQITPGLFAPRPEIATPARYRLGEDIRLLGYNFNAELPEVDLFWQADRVLPADYVVFLHLLDEAGQQVWGADAPPLNGLYPTSAWRANYPVADRRDFAPPALPPGRYLLAAGMYAPDTLARLAVSAGDGRAVPDNAIPLITLIHGADGSWRAEGETP